MRPKIPDSAQRPETIRLEHAVGSVVGRVRPNNEDSGYAGARLLAVADGMGGHVGGEIASSTAISNLIAADTEVPVTALTRTLGEAVRRANEAIARRIAEDVALTGMGTTLTAMLWSGARMALAHIGDCRAYRLRDGHLEPLTEDHTLEALLAAELGRPVRHGNRLTRVLDGNIDRRPDLSLHQAMPGDRYLLCSDGLTGPVAPATVYALLATAESPGHAVARLIEQADQAGGPDNITVVVADAIGGDDTARPPLPSAPTLVGAARTTICRGRTE
ncbi:PP2C family protein-serine/threonine phosphatase [Actinoallomurus acaciae]|uniref:PP2C family protein-serine/threonine phosphatase n=1 Tax=Actinoallomurus acaciae TaxID=502577 RepID=A0ABV5Y937_9ACTN